MFTRDGSAEPPVDPANVRVFSVSHILARRGVRFVAILSTVALLVRRGPATIDNMSYASNGIRRKGAALGLLATIGVLVNACGSQTEGASDGPEFTDLSPSELLGGQSGVEGGCQDLSPVVREVALDEMVGGFRPADVLAYAVGTHSSRVRAYTVDPPDAFDENGEITVELELIGTPRWRTTVCGNQLELPVHYRLFSHDGSIDLESTNTMVTTDGRSARLGYFDQFPLSQDWATRVESVLNLNGLEVFELVLNFNAWGMSGRLRVRGVGSCTLIDWPSMPCQIGMDDPVYGERVRELVEHLESEPPRWNATPFLWSDGGGTELTMHVASHQNSACIRVDEAPDRQLSYYVQLPVELQVSTADGRVAAVLPAYLNATTTHDGRWSRFSYRAEVAARHEALGTFAIPELDGNRAVVRLAGDHASGRISIDSLTPVSDALRDTNMGCVSVYAESNGVAAAGSITPLLFGGWNAL